MRRFAWDIENRYKVKTLVSILSHSIDFILILTQCSIFRYVWYWKPIVNSPISITSWRRHGCQNLNGSAQRRVNVIWQKVFGNSLVRQGEYSCESLKLLAATQHVPTGSLLLPAVDSLFHLLSSGSYLGCDTENQMYLGAHACKHKTEIALLLTTLGCLYRGDAVVRTFERSLRSQLKPASLGRRFRR